jgi:hypothetical protein
MSGKDNLPPSSTSDIKPGVESTSATSSSSSSSSSFSTNSGSSNQSDLDIHDDQETLISEYLRTHGGRNTSPLPFPARHVSSQVTAVLLLLLARWFNYLTRRLLFRLLPLQISNSSWISFDLLNPTLLAALVLLSLFSQLKRVRFHNPNALEDRLFPAPEQ